jgi:hypothetical protein
MDVALPVRESRTGGGPFIARRDGLRTPPDGEFGAECERWVSPDKGMGDAAGQARLAMVRAIAMFMGHGFPLPC